MGLEERNFFSDRAIQDDPYPYFAALRELSPVWREPHYGVFMVTGYDEARAVYADTANFSSCNVVSGPFKKFPVPLEGDDVSDIIEQYRDELPFSDQLPSFDPPKHSAHRGLLTKLLTPRRMRENEEFMWRLADSQLAEVIEAGESEFIHGFAEPFTLSVVAELEGVPEADHGLFRQRLSAPPTQLEQKPLEFLYAQFSTYIEDRRSTPRDDIMSAMATAKFPDGSTPQVHDVALLAANLFAGGQETTVRLLSFALRLIAERPDLQAFLRADRERIPGFIEETLRYESPLRSQFRMARRRTTVAGCRHPRRQQPAAAARRRQPRSECLPQPRRLRSRAQRCPQSRDLRARRASVPGRSPGSSRGPRHRQPAARPHDRHPHLGEGSRSGERPPLRLPADVLPARPAQLDGRVRRLAFGLALTPGVRQLQEVRAGDGRHGAGNEARRARREDKAEDEAGRDPLRQAERTREELADGMLSPVSPHLFRQFAFPGRADELRERCTYRAGDGVLRDQAGQLVRRTGDKDDV